MSQMLFSREVISRSRIIHSFKGWLRYGPEKMLGPWPLSAQCSRRAEQGAMPRDVDKLPSIKRQLNFFGGCFPKCRVHPDKEGFLLFDDCFIV